MATRKKPGLETNLVGRTMHLVTDEEAKEEARQQGHLQAVIDTTTAENWWPVIKDYRAIRGIHAPIVAVHLRDGSLAIILEVHGRLVEANTYIWRLDPLLPANAPQPE